MRQKISEATRRKMSKSALLRDNTNMIASLPRGKKHWNWSEKPTVLALHKRLHRKYGPASQFKCADCGKKAHDYSNESGNYTHSIKDYRPRCRSCHIKKDKNWIKR